MKLKVEIAIAAVCLTIVTTLTTAQTVVGDEAGSRVIPAPFVPFEYLVGRWNGTGVRKDDPAQKFRGWPETHTWAWKFTDGQPVGLTLTITGGKILSTGTLTYDSARQVYRLEAVEAGPIDLRLVFEGTFDKSRKYLVFDHNEGTGKAKTAKGTMRLSLWPNANSIRYTMAQDLREADSVQFTRLVEVGLTMEGESLAGTATASERPKCIVTGGAATMTMTYQGNTFPICCTGCRDEFNDNPQKYIKKASQITASAAGRKKTDGLSSSSVGRSEDAFAASDDAQMPESAKTEPGTSAKTAKSRSARASDSASPGSSTAKKKTVKVDDQSVTAKSASRGASLLKLGQNLERAGNPTAALSYYQRVVKEFANTPSAKTAAERIKALSQ